MASYGVESGTGRPRRNCVEKATNSSIIKRKQKEKEQGKELKAILSKPVKLRSRDEKRLLRTNKAFTKELERKARLRDITKMRSMEIEDSTDVLNSKIEELVSAIRHSQHLVVYTGAGISTAASIPDYRGPNGVWTLLRKGQDIRTSSLVDANPTLTHMAVLELYRQGVIQHVVSQNCDGLHLRSGLPQRALSEIHGNMFIEVCSACQPEHQHVRLFDVTERTACRRHWTGRTCASCDGPLRDSIVHFAEKGAVEHPLNWSGAVSAANRADVILCLGTTLKVLKKYACLWGLNRSKSKQPKLYIINLQWTPKDKQAVLKIHGKCDVVMQQVMCQLKLEIPTYNRTQDPLFGLSIPVKKGELESFNTKIFQCQPVNRNELDATGQIKPVTTGQDTAASTGQNDELDRTGRNELARTNQNKLDIAGRNEPATIDKNKPVATDRIQPAETGQNIKGKALLEHDSVAQDKKETRSSAIITNPGWFGKGFRRSSTTRNRKRRKASQDQDVVKLEVT